MNKPQSDNDCPSSQVWIVHILLDGIKELCLYGWLC